MTASTTDEVISFLEKKLIDIDAESNAVVKLPRICIIYWR